MRQRPNRMHQQPQGYDAVRTETVGKGNNTIIAMRFAFAVDKGTPLLGNGGAWEAHWFQHHRCCAQVKCW